MSKKNSRLHTRGPEWAITVRLADGRRFFYYLDDRWVDAKGKPLEQWGRESQALRFATEDEARRVAASFDVNSAAKEYDVIRLAPR